MAKSKTSHIAVGYITPCQNIQNIIDLKNDQLDISQEKLDTLLLDKSSDSIAIQTFLDVIKNLNKELFNLRVEQRRIGCLPGGILEVSQDNQTVISTSSVRRKA